MGKDRTEYNKQYYLKNREKILQKAEQKKEQKKEYCKQYYLKNKEKLKEKAAQYRNDNKDKVKEWSKNYYIDNKDKINEYGSQYRKNNREKINEQQNNKQLEQRLELLKSKLEEDNTTGYTVYMHINKINGKRYIGKTKQKTYMRFCGGHSYHHNIDFTNDIQKYGWNNFEHIVIIDNISKTKASILEIQYILQYNTLDKEYGYNKQVGSKS